MDDKYLVKDFNEFLGIGIPDLLMNLYSYLDFKNKIKSIFILKFPKRMFEYYFSKGFGILERNSNNLNKIPNLEKQIMYRKHMINTILCYVVPLLPPYQKPLIMCG